ncbi:MAG: protein translocase SEC61 complex subunit gamma [Crenarchaeota archaeon]|nr:protein translocase SEC61 complex subunit gamma [Thermoproteota archaeon]
MGKYSNIIEGIRRILRLAQRPSRDEFLNMLKLILAGMFLTGGIAFAIRTAITLLLMYAKGG